MFTYFWLFGMFVLTTCLSEEQQVNFEVTFSFQDFVELKKTINGLQHKQFAGFNLGFLPQYISPKWFFCQFQLRF